MGSALPRATPTPSELSARAEELGGWILCMSASPAHAEAGVRLEVVQPVGCTGTYSVLKIPGPLTSRPCITSGIKVPGSDASPACSSFFHGCQTLFLRFYPTHPRALRMD